MGNLRPNVYNWECIEDIGEVFELQKLHKGREDSGLDRGMSCRDFSSVAKLDFFQNAAGEIP